MKLFYRKKVLGSVVMSLDIGESIANAPARHPIANQPNVSHLRSRHLPANNSRLPNAECENRMETVSAASSQSSPPSPSAGSWSRRLTFLGEETLLQALYSPQSINIYQHVRRALAFGIYSNLLLIFLPLGIVGGLLHWHALLVFILNFLAVIPLSALLSYSSEKLSDDVGDLLGSLLNATFGNSVELAVRLDC